MVKLLPTPVAHDDGKTPEAHMAMKARMKGGPRNGITSLTVLAKAGFKQPVLLTSSPAASPARALAPQASARDSSTPKPFCGTRCDASLASFDPDTYSSKTSRTYLAWRRPQASLLEACGEPFSQTWPRSGSLSAGTVFPLVPSAPRTSVTGSSPLLGTPMARDGRPDGSQNVPAHGGRGSSLMKDLLPLLPTPTRHMVKDTGAPSEFDRRSPEITATVLNLLPTPHGMAKEGQHRRPGPTGNELGRALTGATTSPPSPAGKPSTGLRLNPSFVGWMMGTPCCSECGREWTDSDCPHSATAFTSTSDGSPVST